MADGLYPHEKLFYYLGLNNPTTRALAAFTATNALILLVKPSWAYTKDGLPRKWKGTAVGAREREQASWVPWWAPSIMTAAAMGLFI